MALPFSFSKRIFIILLVIIQVFLIAWYVSVRFDTERFLHTAQQPDVPFDQEFRYIYSLADTVDNPFDRQFDELGYFYDLIYSRLVKNIDGTFVPDVFVSWTKVDAGWEFRMRNGMKFHDGTDVTLDDVVTSIHGAEMYSPELSFNTYQKIDDNTLFVQSKDDSLLGTFSYVYVVPARWQIGDFNGSGPYKVRTVQSYDEIATVFDLVPNNAYYTEVPFVSEKITIFQSRFRVMARAISGLLSGKIFHVYNLPVEYAVMLRQFCDTTTDYRHAPYFLMRNFSSAKLNDSFYDLVKNAVLKHREEIAALYPDSELIQQFASPGIQGFNPNAQKISSTDVNALEATEPMRLTLYTTYENIPLALRLGQAVSTYNIAFDIQPVLLNELFKKMALKDGDLYLMNFDYRSSPSLLRFIRLFLTQDGVLNTGYDNTDVEAMFQRAVQEQSASKQLMLLWNISEITGTNVGVPLFDTRYINVFCEEK